MAVRWGLFGLLMATAVAVLVTGAPTTQEESPLVSSEFHEVDEDDSPTIDWMTEKNEEIDYDDTVYEDDMDEHDLDELADEIADDIANDENPEGRSLKGAFKVMSKGLMKGGKKVGKAVLTAGKKVIKVTAKGVKIAGKGAGKGIIKIGKGMGKGLIKLGKGGVKGLQKAKKMITKKGSKIWTSLKAKLKGDVAKAGKKLLKKVGAKILEKGFEMAVEAVTPMVVEYILQKTQEGLCSCEGTTCSCCAQPPGFEKGCMVIKVRPRLKIFTTAIAYNGEELSRVNITSDETDTVCATLPGIASFMQACIKPLGTAEIEGGFRGCLALGLDPLPLEREMCVDFIGTPKDGVAKFVSANEIDDVEVEVETQ